MGIPLIFAVAEMGSIPLTGLPSVNTPLTALAGVVFTAGAFSPASTQAKPDSPAITVESLAAMVVEPLPLVSQFRSGTNYPVAPNRQHGLEFARSQKFDSISPPPVPARKRGKCMSRRNGQNPKVHVGKRADGTKYYFFQYWADIPRR
jgi:hypothetical protein